MVKIDSTYFGSIIVDGNKIDGDVIVYWDGEVHQRPSSHNFTKAELRDILMKDPDVIVIGTGTGGLMKVDADAEIFAKLKGVELISKLSLAAVQEFNKLAKKRKAVAVIHVTC